LYAGEVLGGAVQRADVQEKKVVAKPVRKPV
jgi:hypothetical protein